MTLAILASFSPAPGRESEVHALLCSMVDPSRQEPGCRRYDLYRASDDQTGYHIFEVYDDDEAVRQHRDSEHYKAYRANIADLLAAPIALTTLHPEDVLP